MITPAAQHKALGACVHADGESVIMQVGNEILAMTPEEARRFIDWLAKAYYKAHIMAFKASVGGEIRGR